MEKPIFFSDILKKRLVECNVDRDDQNEIFDELYVIGVNQAVERAMAWGKGHVYEDDLLREVDRINVMFNAFHLDKDLKGLFLPPKNWFKEVVRNRLKVLLNNSSLSSNAG